MERILLPASFCCCNSMSPGPTGKCKGLCSHLHYKTCGTFRNEHHTGNFNAAEHIYLLMCCLGTPLLFCQFCLPPHPPKKRKTLAKSFAKSIWDYLFLISNSFTSSAWLTIFFAEGLLRWSWGLNRRAVGWGSPSTGGHWWEAAVEKACLIQIGMLWVAKGKANKLQWYPTKEVHSLGLIKAQ